MLNATGVEPEFAASVTTRFMTPIPLSRAARRTTFPAGSAAAVGKVQVELAAQRALMPTTVTGFADLTFSVQPSPLPRPSAIVTGTWRVPAIVAGADFTASFPGTNVSLTMIVPAPAGAARTRAARIGMRMRRSTGRILLSYRADYHSRRGPASIPGPGRGRHPSGWV